jgi:hypothetical protein
MRRRNEWVVWIRAVEREYRVSGVALDLLHEKLRRNPSYLTEQGWTQHDLTHLEQNRERTYLVRMFAVFENGLREVWAESVGKTSYPKTSDLIDGISARCRVEPQVTLRVHAVRAFRNGIVHEGAGKAQEVLLDVARSDLCRYFSFLPPHW